MRPKLLQQAQQFFQSRLGIPLDELLLPIEPDRPTGKSVRGNGVYTAIREARREDDSTLQMGIWTHELKQADWDKVSDLAAHALISKSKDLQLAAWLLEAQIAKAGFEAIPACMLLMQALCERYWDTLYPRIDEGDQEYRANILRWVNEKLLPQVRLLPITVAGRGPREFGWADFEQAKRNEQIRAKGRHGATEIEGVTAQEFQSAMSSTATETHSAHYYVLADALEAIEMLAATLDQLWGDEAPSLNGLAGLLEQIQALIAGELYKRGVRLASPRSRDEKPVEAEPPAGGGAGGGGAGGHDGGEGDDGSGDGPIRSRADAYHRLAVIADYLASLEPHSPVPYLILRAVEWGNMNTAELYHEMFLKFGGNLNVFELLGLEQGQSNK
ncbi:type VI secretion system protein TssA [Chitinimonas koreensis]|uniref:type VI secretion system protein TssA n=1 Tax=Chitinimonas koreensis TaxID=356302 RepID=UPI0003F87A44|nr:type VI secretion system protein TssA [Chitinimonas koreensis]QNM95336.1 type VI secretion system protein TssA [Chitinimonas koreensis]